MELLDWIEIFIQGLIIGFWFGVLGSYLARRHIKKWIKEIRSTRYFAMKSPIMIRLMTHETYFSIST